MVAGPPKVLDHLRRLGQPRLGGDGPLRPGRARRAGQSILLCHRRRPSSPAWRRHRPPVARMPRRDTIATSLEEPRRADPRATPGARPAGSPTASRPEHLELSLDDDPVDRPDPPRRRDLRRSPFGRGAGRLLRRPQPRAADHAQRALLSPLGVPTSEAHQPHRHVSEAGPRPSAKVASVLAHGWEGLQAHARSAEMRLIRCSRSNLLRPATKSRTSGAAFHFSAESAEGLEAAPRPAARTGRRCPP